jgi:hypothetical protein
VQGVARQVEQVLVDRLEPRIERFVLLVVDGDLEVVSLEGLVRQKWLYEHFLRQFKQGKLVHGISPRAMRMESQRQPRTGDCLFHEDCAR